MNPLQNRYLRNNYTHEEQHLLQESHVLLIGLGGLGGHVFDCLLRLGVGHITAVDGDDFEASNLNRQLLSNESNIGKSKALTALHYGKSIQSTAKVHTIQKYLHREEFLHHMANKDLVIDALGGLEERLSLHLCAKEAGLPLVSAGIAGQTGWVCALMPHEASPVTMLGTKGVEEELGNLPFTVLVAAGLQCSLATQILLKKKPEPGILFFDLNEPFFLKTCIGKPSL